MKNSRWMRFLLITLSVVMVLSLFACGGNGGEEETTVDNTEETTVGGGDETTVGGDDETTVGGGDDETTVGGGDETTVGGGDETTVGGGDETTVGGGEETTVPEPVYEGNWFVSVDAFFADMDSYLGNYGAGDFSEIDTLIMGACTNNASQIIANKDGAYPSVTGNYICLFGGWIAVDGHDVENFVCNIYAADGTVLKTVELGTREGEAGLAETVQGMLTYSSTTAVPRVGSVDEMIDLSEFAGQTVTVVYSADVVGTEFTLDVIKVDVEVPAPIESNVSLTPDKLAGITNVTNVGSITLSEDGSYVTVKPVAGVNDVYLYAYSGNTEVSGRYAIIKYRTSSNATHFNIYASTSRDGAADGDDMTSAYIVADGEWHVMLVDLDAVKTVEADENGEYTVKFLRLDLFRDIANTTGNEEVDIAYVGVHDSIADLDIIANSSNILELGNQFTFSVDSVNIGGNILASTPDAPIGFNGDSVKVDITVNRDNANVVFNGGWIAVNGHAFTDMGLYYQIVDANGNATKITNAGMNIKAADEDVITHCATANPGATPMRIDTDKGGLILPDLKGYSGQTVTVYIYAISDTMWAEHGVIAGKVVLALTVTVERSFKVSVNGVDYEDVVEAFAAAQNGDTIKLGKDVTVPTALVIDKEITVDLNGHTISAPEDTVGDGVFHVVEGGVLTINGNGTVNGVCQSEYDMAVWADGGKVIINGGTYTNVGAGEDTQYDLIYVKNGGEIVINGGTFICATPKWTLNSHDTLKGTITVNGGTFYKYDPANMATETGITSWVADGLYGKADGDNYVVVPYYNDLDVVYAGDSLLEQITNGYGDSMANSSAVLNADGTITITRNSLATESYFTILVNPQGAAKKTTGQYLVIKYRNASNSKPGDSDNPPNIYASTTEYSAMGGPDAVYMTQQINDGEWHVMVVDLAAVCKGVTATDGVYQVNYVRFDLGNRLMTAGDSYDLAYVGFCDDLADVYAGETKMGLSELTADYRVSAEGATAGLASVNPNESLTRTVNSNAVVSGGWIARKVPFNAVVYKIVDANGVETAWTVNDGAIRTPENGLAGAVAPGMANTNGTLTVVRTGINIDLSAYAGQTVTVYVATANVVDGSFNTVSPLFIVTANVPQ